MSMKLGMQVYRAENFRETVAAIVDYERVGVERVAVPEAYTFDSVTQLAYIASRTERIELQTGILPLYTRTPTNLAMTAAGLDYVSDGRAVLGLGASGPQVIEGFHGVKYDFPIGRTCEHVDICRQVWRREKVEHHGTHYDLPLTPERGGSGLGKPLKLMHHPVRDRIPMLLAATGPKNTALAAELFEEFQPFLFHPEHARAAFGDALREGTAKRDPALPPLTIVVTASLLVTDDRQQIERARQAVRDHAALYIGGMGARGKNFYNALAVRYGYEREAALIQDLYLGGRKEAAAAAVPDDLVDAISMIGTKSAVAERVAAFEAAGVGCALVEPVAPTHPERLEDMQTLRALIGG